MEKIMLTSSLRILLLVYSRSHIAEQVETETKVGEGLYKEER